MRDEANLNLETLNKALLERKIIGGLALDEQIWLLAVTEKKTRTKMDKFVAAVVSIIEEKGGKA